MKKIIFLLLASVLSIMANAQIHQTLKPTYYKGNGVNTYVAAGVDTLTNTDTVNATIQIDNIYDVAVKEVLTRVSGTAAGTILLQGSDDKTTWITLSNTITGLAPGQVSDTVTVSNAASKTYWYVYGGHSVHKWKYYRLNHISSGTGVTAPVVLWYLYATKQ